MYHYIYALLPQKTRFDVTGISNNSNIDKAFTVSGLGELVELTSKADRVVQL